MFISFEKTHLLWIEIGSSGHFGVWKQILVSISWNWGCHKDLFQRVTLWRQEIIQIDIRWKLVSVSIVQGFTLGVIAWDVAPQTRQ